ncbi:SDR family NAD(P)-dependent oxidoreductase [Methanoregula sp.]|uniref:SDR family NAD(P)-dependent oxidoreductase n=1 Tax=Methanoregula sp. TaxID=2052170 RepID=UPI000CC8A38F|nr:SDR family oxidoreductase [Methanoregula sp.]PKG32891.1 MAG: hypothetical protein CW742_05755 [Methanoregula sp.]
MKKNKSCAQDTDIKWDIRPRTLVVGASGGIGMALLPGLSVDRAKLGVHCWNYTKKFMDLSESGSIAQENFRIFCGDVRDPKYCDKLVEDYVSWAGGIDNLVVLCGGIANPCHWSELSYNDWNSDLALNLSAPFFISRKAFGYMKQNNHGRIILFSTESSLHGGSPFSLPYATGKLGIECLVKGFAREGAKCNITVNGIRPGFIASGFHERWQFKTEEDLKKRIDLVPMKRAGTPAEVADLVLFLLSRNAGYITGDTISISGGDWL